jgi:hydrogenase maturation protease
MAVPRILVMGVGNLLMGDEGVGVHAIRLLEQSPWPADVSLLDGGTGGFHLLAHFGECDVLLMIDATMDGAPPGTVALIEPRYASDFPKALSAHDIGLKDLVESAALLKMMPRVLLVTISVAELQDLEMTLSPAVEASLPHVVDLVTRQINDLRC